MKTVNSLSGGKTSSYIAMHYPADIEIFSLVCIEDHNAKGTLDRKTIQKVNDKLEPYSNVWGDFKATAEDPKTVYAMFDLEQLLGREITWVRGISFDVLIQHVKKFIPNKAMRFCTTEMKMRPIFEYLHMTGNLPCSMRIGYRHDEEHRKEKATTSFKFAKNCNLYGENQQNWETMEWRTNEFPLIDNKIIHYNVKEFWNQHDIDWPLDSNCQMCFWKQPQQLRKNFNTNPAQMKWALVMEGLMDAKFRGDISLNSVSHLGIQEDFNFGGGSGCQAGFCTD